MKWKILSSEYLFKDTWFTVRKDKCETPDGKIVDPYYVYEFPTWATALPVTKDNKVVMVKQYRHAIEDISLEIPGGCVDDTDKNFEEAIARELLEETGYSFDHNEEIDVELYSIDELKKLVKENKIVQSMHVTCIFYGLQKLGELNL